MSKSGKDSHWNILWVVTIVLILVVMHKCDYKSAPQKAAEEATESIHQSLENLRQNSESLQQKMNELQKRNEPCNN